MGPSQAAKYDETMKVLVGYIAERYDHRVSASIQHKDINIGNKLLVKPTAPTIEDPNDSTKIILDKEGQEWVEYGLKLKKYVDRTSKLEDDIQQIYNVIIGQCSPSMEQALASHKDFKTVEVAADSIGLITMIEQICYNYQPHEYPPLGAWEALDQLGKSIQPEDVTEADHYETVKTIVEVCKASGVNFALLCTHTVDMAITQLHKESKLSTAGKYKDGRYFDATDAERALIDARAEEICIATRLLSLASNKKFAPSKQELKNDLVKGKDNYPRTVAGVLKFLSFHNLTGKVGVTTRKTPLETVMLIDADGETKQGDKKSTVCRLWEEGKCAYKKKHLWSQYPRNQYSRNSGKECDESGELVLCTVNEMNDMLEDDDDLDTYDCIDNDNLDNQFHFYTNVFNYDDSHYVFSQRHSEQHATTHKLKRSQKVNKWWILLDSQSTVDLFSNPRLLTNIRSIDKELKVRCNAGIATTNLIGDLPGYGTVWYLKDGIANILSLHRVASKLHVQYDSRTDNTFIVWKEDGSSRRFIPAPKGLYYCNVNEIDGTVLNQYGEDPDKILAQHDDDPDQIETVENNK